MSHKRVRVVVTGDVQGVGFRASCARQANALGMTGWVRNEWDGSVEALFEGAAAVVDAMVAWCHDGPPMAHVTGVEVSTPPDALPERGFRVRG
jgi:acylphosphatase